jgi:DnaJ-domain-containing protein 1
MAPRFSRRREPADEPSGDDPETVDLDDADHAWWAQRPVEEVWRPRERPSPEESTAPRDVLAEHFGADWRTSFGFDPPAPTVPEEDPGPTEAEPPVDTSDAYAVLGVDAVATWEEIVDAHRRMARRHHPDRLVGRPEHEVAAGEDRIRAVNAAYAELKVRRGR